MLALLTVAGVIGLWGYLLLVADPDTPDELEGTAFPGQAQEVCAEARALVDALPPALDADSPADRAVAVGEANGILTEMVADLRSIAPTEGRDGRLTGLWLADWDTYLADRVEFADALAAGEDAELLVTSRGTGQITVTLDNFARVNDMPDCQVPLDA